MHELFEHTADLGLRIICSDLNTLFAEAGQCLFSAILENPDSIRANLSHTFSITDSDREYLLFDWLNALLRKADEEKLVFGRFEVAVTEHGLKATAWGERIDPSRHHLSREVKAITYHELKVEPTVTGWLAEVIVDI